MWDLWLMHTVRIKPSRSNKAKFPLKECEFNGPLHSEKQLNKVQNLTYYRSLCPVCWHAAGLNWDLMKPNSLWKNANFCPGPGLWYNSVHHLESENSLASCVKPSGCPSETREAETVQHEDQSFCFRSELLMCSGFHGITFTHWTSRIHLKIHRLKSSLIPGADSTKGSTRSFSDISTYQQWTVTVLFCAVTDSKGLLQACRQQSVQHLTFLFTSFIFKCFNINVPNVKGEHAELKICLMSFVVFFCCFRCVRPLWQETFKHGIFDWSLVFLPPCSGGWVWPLRESRRSWAVPACLSAPNSGTCAGRSRSCCPASRTEPGWPWPSVRASSDTRGGTAPPERTRPCSDTSRRAVSGTRPVYMHSDTFFS